MLQCSGVFNKYSVKERFANNISFPVLLSFGTKFCHHSLLNLPQKLQYLMTYFMSVNFNFFFLVSRPLKMCLCSKSKKYRRIMVSSSAKLKSFGFSYLQPSKTCSPITVQCCVPSRSQLSALLSKTNDVFTYETQH